MNEENQSKGEDRSQMLLVVLVILAFIASLVMLFTDSDGALKIALLAALWAALLGAFLVFRSRKDVEATRTELEHQEELHRAQLKESTSSELQRSDRDAEVLADIQRELVLLRTQLEQLAGREFGYEPAALRAEARRIMELENIVRDTSEEETAPEVVVPVSQPAKDARPSGAPSMDAIAGRIAKETPSRPHANPLAELIAENKRREQQDAQMKTDQEKKETKKMEGEKEKTAPSRLFDTGSFQAVPWDEGGTSAAKTSPKVSPDVSPEKAPAPSEIDGTENTVDGDANDEAPEASRRGRRRRDEQSESLSVADLLARARSLEEN